MTAAEELVFAAPELLLDTPPTNLRASPCQLVPGSRRRGEGLLKLVRRILLALDAGVAVAVAHPSVSSAGAAVTLGQIVFSNESMHLPRLPRRRPTRQRILAMSFPPGPYGVITSWQFRATHPDRGPGKAAGSATHHRRQPIRRRVDLPDRRWRRSRGIQKGRSSNPDPGEARRCARVHGGKPPALPLDGGRPGDVTRYFLSTTVTATWARSKCSLIRVPVSASLWIRAA